MATVRQMLDEKERGVHSIGPDEPVLAAIQLMADKSIGAVLVMRGNELAGILSERDYARKVILLGRSSAETPVWEIMSSPVTTVRPSDTINTCMLLMTERKIRHLPVVEEGRVVGVLSIIASGYLADRIGRRTLLGGTAAAIAASTAAIQRFTVASEQPQASAVSARWKRAVRTSSPLRAATSTMVSSINALASTNSSRCWASMTKVATGLPSTN